MSEMDRVWVLFGPEDHPFTLDHLMGVFATQADAQRFALQWLRYRITVAETNWAHHPNLLGTGVDRQWRSEIRDREAALTAPWSIVETRREHALDDGWSPSEVLSLEIGDGEQYLNIGAIDVQEVNES